MTRRGIAFGNLPEARRPKARRARYRVSAAAALVLCAGAFYGWSREPPVPAEAPSQDYELHGADTGARHVTRHSEVFATVAAAKDGETVTLPAGSYQIPRCVVAGSCVDIPDAVTDDFVAPPTGIGTGPLADRPATCALGRAYWATDQGDNWNRETASDHAAHGSTTHAQGEDGALFQCTSDNTWTLTYTPPPYPRPTISMLGVGR